MEKHSLILADETKIILFNELFAVLEIWHTLLIIFRCWERQFS